MFYIKGEELIFMKKYAYTIRNLTFSIFSFLVSIWLIMDPHSSYTSTGYITGYISSVMIIVWIVDIINLRNLDVYEWVSEEEAEMYKEAVRKNNGLSDMSDEQRAKIVEYINYLKENGGADSDIEDFCKANGISYREYESIKAEMQFKDTACEMCKYNTYNLGPLPMDKCSSCWQNPRFEDNFELKK